MVQSYVCGIALNKCNVPLESFITIVFISI